MRSRVVSVRDMRDKFGAEVRGFRYAFVLPTHSEGWDSHALVPTDPVAPPAANDGEAPRRRASDKKPTYIEIKPRS